MAYKLIAIGLPAGAQPARAVIRNQSGQTWTGTGVTFEAYQTANIDTYGRAMTQQGTASRHFELSFPALPEDFYQITYYQPAGGTLVEGDTILGTENWDWNGTTRIYPSDLKQILATALTEGASGRLVGGVVNFFNVATPTGTVNSLPAAVPGAANGLPINGSNAPIIFSQAAISGTLTLGTLANNGEWIQTGAVTATSASNDFRINGVAPGAANGLVIAGLNAAINFTSTNKGAPGMTLNGYTDSPGLSITSGTTGVGVQIAGGVGVAIEAAGAGLGSKGITISSTGNAIYAESTGGAYGVVLESSGQKALIVGGTGATFAAVLVADTVGLAGALTATNAGNDFRLGATERNSIAAALLGLANGVETGMTVKQTLQYLAAVVLGEIDDAGAGTETFKAAGFPATTRVTYTVDEDGNRSEVVFNG